MRDKPKLKPINKGYCCSVCGEHNPFSAYVYAHWTIELHAKCQKCGAAHIVLEGTAIPNPNPAP